MRSPRTVSLFLCTIVASGLACNPSNPAETGPGTTGPGTTGPGTGAASTTTPTTGDASTTPGTSSTDADTSIISTGDLDSCGFICDTTGGPGRAYPCDTFQQDCQKGYKCSVFAYGLSPVWNETKCVPVSGNQRPGEGCNVMGDTLDGLDDCVKGAVCRSADDDMPGICIALCSGLPDVPLCPDPATACTFFEEGVVSLCLPACDPLINDCADGEACQPHDDRFVCGPDNSGPAGQVNDSCDGPGACDPGLACAASSASPACDPRASGCCQPYCTYPNDICADPAQTCAQWFDPIDLPADDPGLGVGVCSVAP